MCLNWSFETYIFIAEEEKSSIFFYIIYVSCFSIHLHFPVHIYTVYTPPSAV